MEVQVFNFIFNNHNILLWYKMQNVTVIVDVNITVIKPFVKFFPFFKEKTFQNGTFKMLVFTCNSLILGEYVFNNEILL